MSSVPASESTSPPYDAAEKGTLGIHARLARATAPNEKKIDGFVVVTTEVVPPSREAAIKPPPTKVSKWILWKLWFNTYRFVSIISIGSDF